MADNPNVNKVVYGNDTIMDITDTTAEAADVAAGKVFYARSGARSVGTGDYMDKVTDPVDGHVLTTDANGQAQDGGVALSSLAMRSDLGDYYTKTEADALYDGKADADATATDSTLGLVKTNSVQSITLDNDGKLVIGGRMGQFSSQEIPVGGLYYPLTIQPEKVAANSILISEATGLTVGNKRIFALFAGAGVTLKKTAAAGATTFEVSNTFANRFTCAAARGGYATIDESSAGTIIVKVTSVHTANDPNTQLVPYSGATESGNNIIITTDAPVSTDASLSKLRLYGSMAFDSSVHIGQGVGTGGVSGKGKLLQLGQSQCSLDGNSILVGNAIFSSKNRCAIFGASHINHVQSACLTGEGQDTTNGTFVGVTAHGKYSDVGASTAFAIGNGESNTARSNLFEVRDASGQTEVVMKSPNGTAYKLTLADDGTLTTTAVGGGGATTTMASTAYVDEAIGLVSDGEY